MSAFLTQLGVQAWAIRPEFAPLVVQNVTHRSEIEPLSAVSSKNPVSKEEPVMNTQPETNEISQAAPFILIGQDLESIWLNDALPEWALLKNIANAFQWPIEQCQYFDTARYDSEDSVFEAIEQIMELDADWVLSMDADSLLAEHLAEGLQIVNIPNLGDMLENPASKKACFLTLSPLYAS